MTEKLPILHKFLFAVIAVIITFGLISVAYTALAEEGDTATAIKSIRDAKELKATTTPAQLSLKPKNKDQIRLAKIVNERANLLKGRWNALSERLERISGRTSSLLEKLSASGFDTTTAEALLNTANEKISVAKARAETAYNTITEAGNNSNGTARDLYRIENTIINPEKDAVNLAFQEAKDALSDCLSAIPQN